ncbi:hypothetical protein NC653_030174 [Populus alba x Populus x berolinensis]|uniref:Uncharacterized protein n=1 Tax=Populus alba x Populus x berolinensis TaxID=444605 RepID=A0AAD6PZX4_9ROSI|nr:hypothetical protein NC653_030174 [Populus alba x Populus x berolinensis]
MPLSELPIIEWLREKLIRVLKRRILPCSQLISLWYLRMILLLRSQGLRDKDIENGTNTTTRKFWNDGVYTEWNSLAVPAVEVRANQDDDMVPWLNYPLDESLQHDLLF